MLARDIVNLVNSIAPPELIEENWDNSGLQIGSLDSDIKRILISLDVSPLTVKYALDNNIDMIISHHPFFFTPIKSITQDNIKGKMITDLIKNDIIVYSMHTNLDSAENGTSEILSNKFKLSNTKILTKSYIEKLYKVAVYVPTSHSDIVRNAMAESGGGFIGNYSHCTFSTKGTGTFMPREGANPFIGESNKLEYVEEEKVETIVSEKDLNTVIESMLKAHPYEEVAYDVYNLHNKGKEYGYGRVGEIKKEMTLYDMALLTKEILDCDSVRLYGSPDKLIKKVAICGGSGIDFLKDVYSKKADVYITGDIKYHDAQLALEEGISLIDAGHFYTEKVVLPYIRSFLDDILKKEVQVLSYSEKSIPFMTI
ncbi:Nif3-like dinuclear metal center hexameric protein [Proteiniborus sp. MB09-C3]|uniref:Nif3-like dinuclear metal center hexameric protein n=1 Tax=Proteiniborus sp. MB09-C3 TaxID=3050072 RepID=UPI00255411C4|nr:Nif3-like dinuclear metal center hexameric protein [Proteiniborus sp. MB09-C3]WIV10712.1 Nif3-like dinuclear metal center hexameric protein [Proteiniborus sp. MB09-C3]